MHRHVFFPVKLYVAIPIGPGYPLTDTDALWIACSCGAYKEILAKRVEDESNTKS